LQNARLINGTSFNGSVDITITAASSTLLANNNTWTGTNTGMTGASTTLLANVNTFSATNTFPAIVLTSTTGTSTVNKFSVATGLYVSGFLDLWGTTMNSWATFVSQIWASITSSNIIAKFTGCSGIMYLGADGACHNDSTASSTLLANNNTWTGTNDFSGSTFRITRYKTVTFPASTNSATTTTATSTVWLGSSYVPTTFNASDCKALSGTVQYQISDGTNKTETRQATSTMGRSTLTTNNSFTGGSGTTGAGENIMWEVGPLTNSIITCTFSLTEN
jgi:hypothetical protein